MTQEALRMALDFVETVHVGEWVGSIERQLEVITAIKEALAQTQEPVVLEEYDAGLLNDFGGGNVEWWQDYIRAELGRAYEHYQSQITTPPQQEHCQCPECKVTLHASDCAVHSEPAFPKGECDCGAQTQEPVAQPASEEDMKIYKTIASNYHKDLSTPLQRKPLTDEWIRSRCGQTWVFETAKQWIRLAEAAHGIKDN